MCELPPGVDAALKVACEGLECKKAAETPRPSSREERVAGYSMPATRFMTPDLRLEA